MTNILEELTPVVTISRGGGIRLRKQGDETKERDEVANERGEEARLKGDEEARLKRESQRSSEHLPMVLMCSARV
jgi:hypothetical protein